MVYEFGLRLLQLRKAKNLTQQALVDRAKALDPDLHLSDSALGKYEGDHSVPRLAEAAALAEVLGVSLDFLTSGETSRTLPLKGLNETQIQPATKKINFLLCGLCDTEDGGSLCSLPPDQMADMKQHFREPHFFIESAEGVRYFLVTPKVYDNLMGKPKKKPSREQGER